MMKRKSTKLLASLALLLPTSAFALGLGNISMNSALDQYLDAKIELESVGPDELKGLQVAMASNELFHQHGVDRPEFLDQIQFKVVTEGGNTYVQLTSTAPIREPFLNFLVEAQWKSGRVVRQFTVLVDPPTMVQEAPAPVRAVQTMAPAKVERAQPVAPQPAVAAVAPAVTTTSSGALEYGPTERNDTLWGVAKAMRPSRDITPQQMMVALLRDNPDAFYRNNVNNLKAGYVLRINDPSKITSVSAREASKEINRQYAAWKAEKSGVAVAAAPAASEEAAPIPTEAPMTEEARLKLVSAGDQEGTGTAVAQTEDTAKLQGALTLAKEELAANRQETEELRTRLASLEEQIKSLQRLVNLKDNQLASIQGGAAQPATTTASASLLDNPLVLAIIAIVVLLVGVLGWLLVQRRKMAEYQESILSQSAAAPAEEVAAPVAATAAAEAASGGESSLLTDFSSTTMEGLQTDIGEIDPVSEADVYLAYGRYNQAEDIIAQALQADPDREEYKLKLLEIYYAAKEQEKFVEQAQSFRNSLGGDIGNPMWSKVVVMGRELIPDNPLFAEDVSQAAEVSASAEVLDEITSFEESESAAATYTDEGDVLEELANIEAEAQDLQETESLESVEPEASEAVEETAASEDENVLEFDIGGLGTGLEESTEEDQAALDKLQEDIDENSLDFGGDLSFGEPEEEGVAEPIAEVEEEEAPSVEDELDSLTEGLDELEEQEISFDSVEALEEEADESGLDLEADLAEMANMLDEAGGSSEGETSEEDVEIDMIDLGGLGEADETSAASMDDDNPFADIDEVGTKLDLARAYVDMGDKEGAESILDEVLQEGNDEQKQQAEALKQQL